MRVRLWLIAFFFILFAVRTVSADELSAEPLPNDARQTALFLGEIDALPEADFSEAPAYPLGSRKIFNVLSQTNGPVYLSVSASVVYSGENAVFWLDDAWTDGISESAAAAFARYDTEILPMLWELLGAEKSAGIDNDPRVHVLLTEVIGEELAGYFSSEDGEDPRVNPNSNGMDMVLINARSLKDADGMTDTLAHESEHLLQHGYDTNEDDFIDEGLAQTAAYLAQGGGADSFVREYLYDLGRSLIFWPTDGNKRAYYGSAFLFQMYLYECFGTDILRAEMQSSENGLRGVDAALKAVGSDLTAEEVYQDWMAALLAELLQSAAKFRGYREYVFPQEGIYRDLRALECGSMEQHELAQYGIHAYTVDCGEPFEISVIGDAETAASDLPIPGGAYAMLSSSVNKSLAVLGYDFDLNAAEGNVALSFDIAYDIEDGYDFFYILLKDKAGNTERACPSFARADGSCAVTGSSDGTVRAEIDLSAYAGGTVSVIFAYVTDSAGLKAGVVIDNVALPAIGYDEDFEEGTEGWYGNGWRRSGSSVLQHWNLVVVSESGEPDLYNFDGGDSFTAACPDEKCVFAVSPVGTNSRSRAKYVIGTFLPIAEEETGGFPSFFGMSGQMKQVKDQMCEIKNQCIE